MERGHSDIVATVSATTLWLMVFPVICSVRYRTPDSNEESTLSESGGLPFA